MTKPDPLTPEEEIALRALLDEARSQEAAPSDAFLARVLEDAAQVAADNAVVRDTPTEAGALGLLDRLGRMFRGFGGLPGASVMTASVLFGLAFGYTGPDSLFELTGFSDAAGVVSELDTEMDVFDTASFDFGGGDLLQ